MTVLFFFFFFQAEDGIRDYKVTGVQTCALPILDEMRPPELGVTLDDEDRMATDDDRERDAGEPRDGGGPEPRGVDDDRRVDAIARCGLDAGDAIARRTGRDHLDTPFRLYAPPSPG